MKIGDVANVFRCSIKRDPVGGETAPIVWQRHGLEKWNEVRVENLDPLTGFISPPFLSVRPAKEPDRDAIKPLIDTVICFHGTLERIKRPGLLIYEWACIPGRNLAIIRPKKIDPVWLYYAIKKSLESVEPEQRGGRGFLAMEKIREMELGEYREEVAERINKAHRELVNSYRKYINKALRIDAAIGKVWGNLR